MTIEQKIMEAISGLPPEKKFDLLEYAESLKKQSAAKSSRPVKSLEGALAHLNINISEEDIAQARDEMWGKFPRDIEL